MTKTATLSIIQKIMIMMFSSLLLFGFVFQAHAFSPEENEPDQYVQVKLITDTESIKGGETIRIGLENTIYPQWHIYWVNPGDSGTAPMIDWDLPEGFAVSDIDWPAPEKIPYPPLTNYGYEGTVTLLHDLTVPDTIDTTKPLIISGKVNFLVCHEICIPETHDLLLTLNTNKHYNPIAIEVAEQKLPKVKNWHAEYSFTDTDFILDIQTTEDIAQNAILFPEEWGMVNNNADANIMKTENGFRIRQEIGDRELSEINELPAVLTYDDQAVRIIAQPAATAVVTTDSPHAENVTWWKAILFAVLGGIILNLMPCVFPVLSMKALSLVQLQGKEESKAKLYGLSYTAGILISFGIIAALLIALKSAGAQIGWGFQLQNPIVITLLVYLIFTIGLNLIGVFEFSNKLGGVGQNLTQKDGDKGAFFTGVLATLVATPCTAPFMATAIGFALTQNAFFALTIFLSLGFGLALPYLALCYIPALRQKLPKPGAWMDTFKQLLAFPMFLTAAYLIWVLSQQVNSFGILFTLLGLIAITFIFWLLRFKKSILIKSLILLSIVFLAWVPFAQMPLAPTENSQAYSSERLSELLEGNDPVFTNMTAAWCITCKVNEKIALSVTSTQELFQQENVHYLKGDWTNRDAEISQYLEEFNRSGVPLYVYYPARDKDTGDRPDPIVLPQVLTPGIIKNVIR